MADSMEIFIFACGHVDYSINGVRGLALSTVEGKEPAFTAVVTAGNSEDAIKVDMEKASSSEPSMGLAKN
ncbi:hypothetical protein AC249_AIPGENE11060 [Exaiptasia diaphana]|nr:hypothetical protein AC249_AIPGENE11060 [Exaiptasia diaphana]